MRLLVSNDDGYLAPGLQRLAAALTPLGEVIVVAPDRDRSGASNSLTLPDTHSAAYRAERVHLRRAEHPPTAFTWRSPDCSTPSPTSSCPEINAGANLGDDVIYSGTVAAAMEGRVLGTPCRRWCRSPPRACEHFDTAAQVATRLVERIAGCPLDSNVITERQRPGRGARGAARCSERRGWGIGTVRSR